MSQFHLVFGCNQRCFALLRVDCLLVKMPSCSLMFASIAAQTLMAGAASCLASKRIKPRGIQQVRLPRKAAGFRLRTHLCSYLHNFANQPLMLNEHVLQYYSLFPFICMNVSKLFTNDNSGIILLCLTHLRDYLSKGTCPLTTNAALSYLTLHRQLAKCNKLGSTRC